MSHRIRFSAIFLVIASLALSSCVSSGGTTFQGHRVGGMVKENGHADPVPIDF